MFSVDLSEPCCSWKRVTDTKGTTPSPRNKHSCWVHRGRSVTTIHKLSMNSSPSFTNTNSSGLCCTFTSLFCLIEGCLFVLGFFCFFSQILPDFSNFICKWKLKEQYSLLLSLCRLIYFGGYGCKTLRELRNTSSSNFTLEEMSWVNITLI